MNRFMLVAALALAFAGPAVASEDLAKKNGCTACHGVDKKIVGPAFKDIGKKYAGNAKAEATLVEKVKKGGVGVWGQVPMPPNANTSDADAKTLVKWILGLK